ncbi:YiiX/YebB-like N1pC/P60 family cysteine hydrolase [Parvularcula sp. LCG005]|uniref:YiiX/YebB-like N1pC/P60 family cysteine hydrolase n=1 Tax=Parvularcula sp. LCG005 TaxID=3078805 RepID=UPI002942658B|nr:YiiX/YebB-like N1pC/P60 family cysteine hydrolase [Parvularcula sp. LCG005]WOI53537.1 YiiX/YebB-like N1pC/P60 family cysteine hydrolase [Parvularcula sp. LCG005]
MQLYRLLACLLLLGSAAAQTGDLPARLLQTGDVIFIGQTGSWADIAAQASVGDKRYGHVGIAIANGSDWSVIDAGGSPTSPDARVASKSLNEFLGHAALVGIYRPTFPSRQIPAMTAKAKDAAIARLPFDRGFSLDTEDQIYCTELVWQALSAAVGKDAVPVKTQWEGRAVITLEDLSLSPHLQPVAELVRYDYLPSLYTPPLKGSP